MPAKRLIAALEILLITGLTLTACSIFGGTGACVSDPVQYSFGLRVYCYSEWDKSDCSVNNDEQVNGASWSFYGGQTCEDRDLTEGSNPWP